jgi:hypothetical protein
VVLNVLCTGELAPSSCKRPDWSLIFHLVLISVKIWRVMHNVSLDSCRVGNSRLSKVLIIIIESGSSLRSFVDRLTDRGYCSCVIFSRRRCADRAQRNRYTSHVHHSEFGTYLLVLKVTDRSQSYTADNTHHCASFALHSSIHFSNRMISACVHIGNRCKCLSLTIRSRSNNGNAWCSSPL